MMLAGHPDVARGAVAMLWWMGSGNSFEEQVRSLRPISRHVRLAQVTWIVVFAAVLIILYRTWPDRLFSLGNPLGIVCAAIIATAAAWGANRLAARIARRRRQRSSNYTMPQSR
jgi:hypothetical protein